MDGWRDGVRDEGGGGGEEAKCRVIAASKSTL